MSVIVCNVVCVLVLQICSSASFLATTSLMPVFECLKPFTHPHFTQMGHQQFFKFLSVQSRSKAGIHLPWIVKVLLIGEACKLSCGTVKITSKTL